MKGLVGDLNVYCAYLCDFITKPYMFVLQDTGTGLKEREPEIVQQEERLKVQVSCLYCQNCFCMPDKTFILLIERAYFAA